MDLTKTWTLVRISCINVVDISTFGLINSCLCFVSVQKKELGNSGQSAGKQALMNEHNIHREEDLLCKVFNCKMNKISKDESLYIFYQPKIFHRLLSNVIDLM